MTKTELLEFIGINQHTESMQRIFDSTDKIFNISFDNRKNLDGFKSALTKYDKAIHGGKRTLKTWVRGSKLAIEKE